MRFSVFFVGFYRSTIGGGLNAVTGGNGQLIFGYFGGPTAGTDSIELSGFVDSQLVRCSAAKTWVAGQPSCDTSPSVAANPAGMRVMAVKKKPR